MRIRRAATLVCTFEGDKPVVHNFLKKEMFECNARALQILAALDEWTSMEDALARLPQPEKAVPVLRELIQRDLVLIEGSAQAERDRHYRETWRWGSVAGFYHFSLRDSKFLDGHAIAERMLVYQEESASPPLMTSNAGLGHVTELPRFDLDDPFFESLDKRRTRRSFSDKPIALHTLADCLYAGNGLQKMTDAGNFGRLPLGMTPSGGARNPFDLYVLTRTVSGIEPGIYHYSAAEHSLGLVSDILPDELPPLLGNQEWSANAAAVVFFCATFERAAWKYRQPLAYRVVLMEVGAILQNILLTAAHHGLAAAPTGALAETEIEILLGLQEIEQAVLFAVVLGDPA